MRKNWILLTGVLVFVFCFSSGTGWAGTTISADGVDVKSSDIGIPPSIAITDDSHITNNGSFTAENAFSHVNVSGATVTVDEGGRLIIEGHFANVGDMVFDNTSTLNLSTGANMSNDGHIYFNEGSSFIRAGTETITNSGNIHINTGMSAGQASDLISATTMTAPTAYMYISGATSNIGGSLVYNGAGTESPWVVLQTDGAYSIVNVNLARLRIETDTTITGSAAASQIRIASGTTTFNGNVDATAAAAADRYLQVDSGATAIFDGPGANFRQGAMNNSGTVAFQDNAVYSSSGAITNNGMMSFDGTTDITNAATTITNKTGATLKYHVNMDSIAGAGGFFARTDLETGSHLELNGISSITGDLILNSAASGSFVTITDGGDFNSSTTQLNVKDATLVVNGSSSPTRFYGDVTASLVDVNQSASTTFKKAVNADLIVRNNSGATFDSTATFNSHNITLEAGSSLTSTSANIAISGGKSMTSTGTFNNNSGGKLTVDGGGEITNNAGGVINNASGAIIDNDGSLANSGVFNNRGTYEGIGRLQNRNEFNNWGTFTNATTISGNIVNFNGGTMSFHSSTTYNGSGGTSLIANRGTINADVGMSDASLAALMKDLGLQSGSILNLTAASNATVNGAFALTSAANDSTVNIVGGTSTITLGSSSVIDASGAFLNIGKGTVVLSNGSKLKTTNDFTAEADAIIDFTPGTHKAADIEAKNVYLTSNSVLNVGESNILTITTTGSTGFSATDTSKVTVADSGKLIIKGKSSFDTGSTLVLGKSSVVSSTGDITFHDGSTMEITASGSTISQIISTTGNIDIAGKTEVIFHGTREEIENQIFLGSQTGTITNYDNLYNALYEFILKENWNGTGQGVYVGSMRSVVDNLENIFGKDNLGINKINGGKYTDEVLATDWGRNNTDLTDYIQEASSSTLSRDQSWTAFGQLFGEYAAYSTVPMLSANTNFRRQIKDRVKAYARTGASDCTTVCNVCEGYVLEDPCNACGGEYVVEATSYVLADGETARGGSVWASGFGDWHSQDGREYIHGYDYNAGGMSLGYDYSLGNVTLGIAGSFTNGTLKVDDLNTKYDNDILNIMAYGIYTQDEIYVAGQLGFGYSWNEYDVDMVLGGRKSGEYNSYSITGGLEIGYDVELDNGVHIIPSVGFDFTYINQDGWNEKVYRHDNAPILANSFGSHDYNSFEIPIGLRVNKVIDLGGVRVIPEARAAFIYEANHRRNKINMSYLGGSGSTTMYGVSRGPTRGLFGVGIKAIYSNNFAIGVDYNLGVKRGYREHNLLGTLDMDF